MKHRVFLIGATAFFGVLLFVQPAQAAQTYTGVSEKTYFQVKNIRQSFERTDTYKVKTALGTYTKTAVDARVIAQFHKTTVLRTDKKGELFYVQFGDGGSMFPTVQPGIYINGNSYYYIAHGVVEKISSTDPQKAFVNALKNYGVGAVVPVNNTQFTDFFGRGGTNTEILRAKAIQKRLEGYAVMNISDRGKMYFVPNDAFATGANPIEITPSNYTVLTREAERITTKKLNEIRKNF